MENPFDVQVNKPQRPTFLVVLCILTFIGSGWSILSNLFSLFTSSMMDSDMHIEQYSEMIGDMGDSGTASFMSGFLNSSMEVLQATAAHALEINTMQMVLSLISLLGAILMLQLRRFGFYLYTAAQILALFVLPYFAGFSTLVVIGMFWSALISLAFIIMYAVNLKYMH